MLVGKLGEDALAAGAIGITYFNLMFYFLIGVSSALDTLGAQAYGADDKAGVISWQAIAGTTPACCCMAACALLPIYEPALHMHAATACCPSVHRNAVLFCPAQGRSSLACELTGMVTTLLVLQGFCGVVSHDSDQRDNKLCAVVCGQGGHRGLPAAGVHCRGTSAISHPRHTEPCHSLWMSQAL